MLDALHATAGALVDEFERRFPYAAALLTSTSGLLIADSGTEQSATEQDPSRGIVFTIYDGKQFFEYATSELAPDALAREVRAWAAGLRVRGDGPALAHASDDAPPGSKREAFATPMRVDPARVPLSEKLAFAREVRQRAAALDTRITRVQAVLFHDLRESVYIGRGRVLEQRVTRTNLSLSILAVVDGQVGWHFLSTGGTTGLEALRITGEDLAHVAEVALKLTEARPIEPGEYDIVTDPSLSGVIAHESFGHGTELDLFPKGRARAAHFVGKRVAAPGVDMDDDPSRPGAFGSYFFDDEGELARPTRILRDGILILPISDLASATFAPGTHTPNGRRQDFTRKVYARMSNTFFAAGTVDPAAMIAGVEHGVYLRHAESGVEDPMGWGVQVTAHYGEEIRDGHLTGRLFAPVGVTGYVPDLLQSISAIGSDFALSPGLCGKGHKEMVATATGGPHLRMRARLG
ncbi:MAG: TldD/PmbA family protein [Ktedonobacterales bacterium]|nr:TldD/PmbA family protein [Ktedonobacterales bacterium]